ncbi:rim15, signal transduction response regulator [Mucor velutinosus]|uniref:Rim15, signal transduction response regulator n=1 Tax=Mucor velutinosus TaxID=708070 RepID=A0AAN7I4K0_9FUNG|nr:rim15, signal transduction response regulator [Mucor velutinosus]
MWPSISALVNDHAMAFAPLIYWIVFGAAMVYYCIKHPVYRNRISYICLLASIFGIIASILSILSTTWGASIEQPAYFVFHGLYITFAFLPFIVAFYTREKQTKQSNAGKYTAYLGLLWAAACILGGLATTIMASIIVHQGYFENEGLLIRLSGGLYFLILMTWGFIAVILLLTLIYFKRLTEKHARSSALTYVLLNLLSTLILTILGFAPLEFSFFTLNALGYMSIFLVDLPNTIAVFVAFHMGHCWIGDNQRHLINNDVHNIQSDQAHHDGNVDANNNDGSKYELSSGV